MVLVVPLDFFCFVLPVLCFLVATSADQVSLAFGFRSFTLLC
jgi:hypothetical protein